MVGCNCDCCVGGFGSDYGAGRGGGPVKTGGFTDRSAGPYGGLFYTEFVIQKTKYLNLT